MLSGNNFKTEVPLNNNIVTESCIDSTICPDFMTDSLKRFVKFDHSDGAFDYYRIRLSMFNSSYARGYFYEAAKTSGIYMKDKSEFDKDSTLFMTGNFNKAGILNLFCDLYDQTQKSSSSLPFTVNAQEIQNQSPLTTSPTCSTAQVACSNNTYNFAAGTTGNAPPSVGGYPNYGCLGSQPCPAFFYMQIGVAGSIIISISQSGGHDVDFICWGPFTNLTDGCATGLTGTCGANPLPGCCNNNQTGCTNFYPRGNITDCSFSPNATETCHILNGQVGEIYILLITNYSHQAGTITVSQSGGTGLTNCNIVLFCSMIDLTATPSTCNGLTNTFSISGNVDFSNPPPTGTLTVTDITTIPNVSQTFLPPFVSPLPYSLTGIPCDGLFHTVTASFSDSASCNISQHYTAPPQSCPQAQISGGGEICNDGITTVPVDISLIGTGPYNITYAINGVSQTPINNYSGASPYVLNTNTAGTYTLVSVSNSTCIGSGAVSGSATVILDPLPIPAITGPLSVCSGSTGLVYTTESGKSNYLWAVSTGGIITSGGNTTDNTVTINWNTPGSRNVSVNYQDAKGCMAASSTILPVTVYSRPIPTITGNNPICLESSNTYTTQSGMTNYQWIISTGGTITSGGASDENSVTITWNSAGSQTVSVNYNDANGCTAVTPTVFPVIVNPLPAPTITGTNSLCVGTSGVVYTTQTGMTNYQWTISAGGTITSGGTLNDFNATVTWNTPGNQTISVNYYNSNNCTANTPTDFPVTVNPLPGPAELITGPSVLCQAATGTGYSVPIITDVITYSWSLIPVAAGAITGNSNSITINWLPSWSGNATVTVTGVNNCGNGSISPIFNILVNPKPYVSFVMCTDSTTIPSARIIQLKKGIPFGGSFSGTGVNTVTGTFNPATAGTGSHTITYSYTNVNGCTNIATRTINVVNPPIFNCGASMKDVRDNKFYKTVFIGTQCWMSESLNFGASVLSSQNQLDNCIPEKYCYADNPVNCTNYGGVYQWDELMAYNNISGSQGICPPGWHVPSEAEWTLLFNNYTNNGLAGSALKATGFSGFNALLSGSNFFNRGYLFLGFAGFYWSSDSEGPFKAWAHAMNTIDASVSQYPSSRSNAFFLRCIKD